MALFPKLNVRAYSLKDLDDAMDASLSGRPTFTGVNVSENLAMNFPAYFACTKVLSETMSSLPCQLKQQEKNGGARDAEEKNLYYLLNKAPNDEMTSADFMGACMVHECGWGNTYAYIDVATRGRNAGQINGLRFMLPDRVKPFRDETGRLKYEYRVRKTDGSYVTVIYDMSQVLHIPGFSFDGLMGYSPVSCARQAIGLGLALEEFQGRFFSNGAHVNGLITAPNVADKPAADRFRESVKEAYAGLAKSHQFMVLPNGTDFKAFSMSLDDAELLASRKFTLDEMCRITRVPPHMVANLDRSTFSNIEHQGLEFTMFTMTPWVRRIEQRMDLRLLTPTEKREKYFAKFNMRGLMRGDMKSQMESFEIGRRIGLYNPNRLLQLLDDNPRTDPGGEEYWDSGPQGQGSKKSPEEAKAALRAALEPVLADCKHRIERRQEDVIEEASRRAKKQDSEGMKAWLNGFYQKHESDAKSILEAYFKALNEPERVLSAAQTVVESLRMGLESVDILDAKAVALAIKGEAA